MDTNQPMPNQDCCPTSVPLVNPVAPAPVDSKGGQPNPRPLANEGFMALVTTSQASDSQNHTISRAAARGHDGSGQRHSHRLPTLLVTGPCRFTAKPPQPFNEDEKLLRKLLSSVLRKNQNYPYSKHAENLQTYYFNHFQKNGMPTPSDIISDLKNNNQQGAATALR